VRSAGAQSWNSLKKGASNLALHSGNFSSSLGRTSFREILVAPSRASLPCREASNERLQPARKALIRTNVDVAFSRTNVLFASGKRQDNPRRPSVSVVCPASRPASGEQIYRAMQSRRQWAAVTWRKTEALAFHCDGVCFCGRLSGASEHLPRSLRPATRRHRAPHSASAAMTSMTPKKLEIGTTLRPRRPQRACSACCLFSIWCRRKSLRPLIPSSSRGSRRRGIRDATIGHSTRRRPVSRSASVPLLSSA